MCNFQVVRNGPFFKQKLSKARAYGKNIEGATVKLGHYCETGAPVRFARGGGAKGAPRSALLRAPSSLECNVNFPQLSEQTTDQIFLIK